jgi:hypothetical protein
VVVATLAEFTERWVTYDELTYDLSIPDDLAAYTTAAGWLPIVEAEKPPDTASTTWDATYVVAGEVASQVWVERPYTADEQAAYNAARNAEVVQQALEESMAIIAAILAATNADINARPSGYIKDLARAQRKVIRHALNDYSGVD